MTGIEGPDRLAVACGPGPEELRDARKVLAVRARMIRLRSREERERLQIHDDRTFGVFCRRAAADDDPQRRFADHLHRAVRDDGLREVALGRIADAGRLEETGVRVVVRMPLGSVLQKGGRKLVHAFWATVAPGAEAAIDERGRCLEGDGENDVCKFFPIEQAYEMMVPAQCAFLDRLREHLRDTDPADRAD